jgi:hypothetical protein
MDSRIGLAKMFVEPLESRLTRLKMVGVTSEDQIG